MTMGSVKERWRALLYALPALCAGIISVVHVIEAAQLQAYQPDAGRLALDDFHLSNLGQEIGSDPWSHATGPIIAEAFKLTTAGPTTTTALPSTTRDPEACTPNLCSGHGVCSKGACFCRPTWGGADCASRVCPIAGGKECGGDFMGMCNAETGKCTCRKGRSGTACEKGPHCPSGSYGSMCQLRRCSPLDCGGPGNGVCDYSSGKCLCKSGWSGAGCQTKTCPGYSTACECFRSVECTLILYPYPSLPFAKAGTYLPCAGNGKCDPNTLKCTCMAGHVGPDCESPAQLGCPENCNAAKKQGICSDGKCKCAHGFKGPSCAIANPNDTRPAGDASCSFEAIKSCRSSCAAKCVGGQQTYATASGETAVRYLALSTEQARDCDLPQRVREALHSIHRFAGSK